MKRPIYIILMGIFVLSPALFADGKTGITGKVYDGGATLNVTPQAPKQLLGFLQSTCNTYLSPIATKNAGSLSKNVPIFQGINKSDVQNWANNAKKVPSRQMQNILQLQGYDCTPYARLVAVENFIARFAMSLTGGAFDNFVIQEDKYGALSFKTDPTSDDTSKPMSEGGWEPILKYVINKWSQAKYARELLENRGNFTFADSFQGIILINETPQIGRDTTSKPSIIGYRFNQSQQLPDPYTAVIGGTVGFIPSSGAVDGWSSLGGTGKRGSELVFATGNRPNQPYVPKLPLVYFVSKNNDPTTLQVERSVAGALPDRVLIGQNDAQDNFQDLSTTFFSNPTSPWALVVRLYYEDSATSQADGSTGLTSSTVQDQVIGVVRLNEYDFPYKFIFPDPTSKIPNPFVTSDLYEFPLKFYNAISTFQYDNRGNEALSSYIMGLMNGYLTTIDDTIDKQPSKGAMPAGPSQGMRRIFFPTGHLEGHHNYYNGGDRAATLFGWYPFLQDTNIFLNIFKATMPMLQNRLLQSSCLSNSLDSFVSIIKDPTTATVKGYTPQITSIINGKVNTQPTAQAHTTGQSSYWDSVASSAKPAGS